MTPPVALNQVLPAYPGQVMIPRSGKIEVVIDESGAVESALMAASVSTTYDRLAIAATKSWKFKPATVDGTPVKFRKVVQSHDQEDHLNIELSAISSRRRSVHTWITAES